VIFLPSIRGLRLAVAGAALFTAAPAATWGWGGIQHVQINKAAGRNVPDEMGAFRPFSRPMAFPGIYPDLWKEADLAETPRHYFEPDRLPAGTDLGGLAADQATAFSQQISSRPDEIGIAPWTITDLLVQMTEAMRTNDWLMAARCGATMGHYVADLHMPLHCTRNFNGQETWQVGIHSRIELDMTKAFFRPDLLDPAPAAYLEDPFREIMGWVAHSASLVPSILNADTIARRSANGRYDTERYYYKLWELTGDTIIQQLSDAVTHLSSLWYTAWVDAGKPAIPGPFAELPTTSLHSGVGIDFPTEDGPAGATLPRQNKTYNAIIWAVMGIIAGVVITSSIVRGIRERKASGK